MFTSYVDVTAEHCLQWFPQCDIPGTCLLPPEWISDDAGLTDAATGAADSASTPVDAASTVDATGDAPQGG